MLTIRSYHEKDEGHDITVNVPEIQLDETQTGDADAGKETFVGDINQEIQTIVDDYVAEAKQKFAEYKEAFFATGGTEEEWGNRDIAVNVDYEVKYQQGNILSMVLIRMKPGYPHMESVIITIWIFPGTDSLPFRIFWVTTMWKLPTKASCVR